jgi:hypothetical protein
MADMPVSQLDGSVLRLGDKDSVRPHDDEAFPAGDVEVAYPVGDIEERGRIS